MYICVLGNGIVNVVWVGQHVQGPVLSSIFGVTSHSQVDTNMVRMIVHITSY